MTAKLLVGLCLAVLLLPLPAAPAAEPMPPIEQWIPQEAVLTLQLSQPKAVLDLLLNPKLIEAITNSPAYKKQASNAAFRQVQQMVGFLELRFGTNWQSAVRKLLGGGVTFAAGPHNATLLVVDSEDGPLLEQLHEVFRTIAEDEAKKAGKPERVASAEYRGVTGWTFNGKEAHAIVGRRFLLGNKGDTLKMVADVRDEPARSLASSPAYRAVKEAIGSGSEGMVFANFEVLKQLPPFQKAMEPAENPLAALLFAGVQDTLRSSTWLGMGLDVEKDSLTLQVKTDGKVSGSGPGKFAAPGEGGGALPNLAVPRRVAALSLYRDLHGFYSAKNELFPERTSGLIFFENMMGIFFTGRDLTDDVFAHVKPEVRVVAAEQAYDPAVGTPEMQFPAFAAVFRMKDPEKFGEVVEEAWQKAIGLVNFTRGQKAEPGLIIDRPSHRDTKLTVAYFGAGSEKDRAALDVRFNFRPTLARFGDCLILSSTDALARDLIDALAKENAAAPKPLAGIHSLLEVDISRVASILGANRESMIRNSMVNEGNTREEAEANIEVLLTALKHLGEAKLLAGSQGDQARVRLDLHLNLP